MRRKEVVRLQPWEIVSLWSNSRPKIEQGREVRNRRRSYGCFASSLKHQAGVSFLSTRDWDNDGLIRAGRMIRWQPGATRSQNLQSRLISVGDGRQVERNP